MPTVQEALKATGMTDEQIAALDKKVIDTFAQVQASAQQTLEQAELAQRANRDYYDKEIVPALNNWGSKEAVLSAERDYYKTLANKAAEGGFVTEVPPFQAPEQQRSPNGQYVPGNSNVPGSPTFTKADAENIIGSTFHVLTDLGWKYQNLYGAPLPVSPTVLAQEAAAQRLPLADYVAKKYDFAGKEQAQREEAQRVHDEAIRKAAIDENERKWAEKTSSNPNFRVAEDSRFATIDRAVKAGQRKDPLTMTPAERQAETARAIRSDIQEASATA